MHFSTLTAEAQDAIVDAIMGHPPANLPEPVKAEIAAWANWCDTMNRPKSECGCPDCGPCLVDIGAEG